MANAPATHGFHFTDVLTAQGWRQNVSATLDGNGFFTSLKNDNNPHELTPINGYAIPGGTNLHCHAFQRAMAGLGEVRSNSADSFWSWREVMYKFVAIIDPDDLKAIAARLYVDFLKGGFTCVGEFHYLHHSPDGSAYDNPAQMSLAIIAAAQISGIALTHLPVFYAHSGFGGAAPNSGQRRFVHSLEGYEKLLQSLKNHCQSDLNNIGIAPHSLRAVTPDELSGLEGLRKNLVTDGPMHIHIAEQLKEVENCVAHCGARPVEWLLDNAEVDDSWCFIHATHMTPEETGKLAQSGAIAGLCPMTEANLGDGIFPAQEFQAAGGKFGVGTDSNIRTNVTEELQMLEYSQRLSKKRRNILADKDNPNVGDSLYQQTCRGGATALTQPAGVIDIHRRADFVVLDAQLDGVPRPANGRYMDYWLFGASDRTPNDVYVAGQQLIANGCHKNDETIDRDYRRVMHKLLAEI
jgi:formimidoylglutamate deiminase